MLSKEKYEFSIPLTIIISCGTACSQNLTNDGKEFTIVSSCLFGLFHIATIIKFGEVPYEQLHAFVGVVVLNSILVDR